MFTVHTCAVFFIEFKITKIIKNVFYNPEKF